MKNGNKIWILVVVIVVILMMQGKEEKKEATGAFTRVSSAATVTPSSSFTITYTATKVDAEWFVNWHDEVTGGCTPTSYENFLARQAGDAETQTKIVTFTAPSSGTCTFQNGYYQFATEIQITLPPLNIYTSHASYTCYAGDIHYYNSGSQVETDIKEQCSGTISNGGWGTWSCIDLTTRNRYRTNTIKTSCSTGQTTCPTGTAQEEGQEVCSNSYCNNGNCDVCDTSADNSPCNGCVSFSEISAYASKWILKQGPSFSDVSGAAARWILRNKATC